MHDDHGDNYHGFTSETGRQNRLGVRKYDPAEVARALREAKGMKYVAAKMLLCSPRTIYNYIKQYPELQDVIDAERGCFVDKAETKLNDAVDNGQAWAIALTLKTLGKDRGYSEKVDHEVDIHNTTIIVHRIEPILQQMYDALIQTGYDHQSAIGAMEMTGVKKEHIAIIDAEFKVVKE